MKFSLDGTTTTYYSPPLDSHALLQEDIWHILDKYGMTTTQRYWSKLKRWIRS